MVDNARPVERGREKTAASLLLPVKRLPILSSFLTDFRVPWASVQKQLLGLCQCGVAGLGCTLGAPSLSLSLSCRSLLLITRDDRTEITEQ